MIEVLPTTREAPALERISLSQAMREGAKLAPQCRHQWGSKHATCALGAVIHYLEGDVPENIGEVGEALLRIDERYAIQSRELQHPKFQHIPFSIRTVIVDLNDHCGWTRETIADWLQEQGL